MEHFVKYFISLILIHSFYLSVGFPDSEDVTVCSSDPIRV